jgi:hypothetical protein
VSQLEFAFSFYKARRLPSASPAGLAGSDGVCERSPCGPDPKVTPEALKAARALVRRERGSKKKIRRPGRGQPLAIAYGMGVDSTAVLVGLAQLVAEGYDEFRPDYIVFADTGSERLRTYRYLKTINRWLRSVGFPEVIVVCYATQFGGKSWGSSRTLEQQCLVNQIMPSISQSKFKYAQCSQLWKQDPQYKWFQYYSGLYEVLGEEIKPRVRARFRRGQRVELPSGREVKLKTIVKVIGYDANEKEREKKGTYRLQDEKRKAEEKGVDQDYTYWAPLIDWGWTRARCVAEIEAAGLKVPPKSACTFCGATKKAELFVMAKTDPGALRSALLVESVALQGRHRKKMKDSGNKGLAVRWNWGEFCVENKLVRPAELRRIKETAKKVVAAAPRKAGTFDVSTKLRRMRLAAFQQPGLRDGGCGWDRYYILPRET